jgi:Mycobacterium membrane protein
MNRSLFTMVALATCVTAVLEPPTAHADDTVTYEVISADVATANIEYFDGTVRRTLNNVSLPWRTEVRIADPRSLSFDGADLRADWRASIAAPVWQPGKWVTVRISIGTTHVCENTLDIGNVACYGSTSFKS